MTLALMLSIVSCQKKEDISGKIRGIWETDWKTELSGNLDDMKVNEIIVFEGRDEDEGDFMQLFSGKVEYDSYGKDIDIPFSVGVKGKWTVEKPDIVALRYDVNSVRIETGNQAVRFRYSGGEMEMIDSRTGFNNPEVSPKMMEEVQEQLKSYFRQMIRNINQDNKAFTDVEIVVGAMTATFNDGNEGRQSIYDKIKPDKFRGSDQDAAGDEYYFVTQRLVTDSDLSTKSKDDLRIMRNYIFARHGYIFKSPDLREYFSKFSWYTPKYSDVNSLLTPLEQSNIKAIQNYEKKGGRTVVAPSYSSDNYSWLLQRKATAADLSGKSKKELRIMRNYIYARHGYIFQSDDLREYFSQFSWYNPRYTDVNSSLSDTELSNIKKIKSYE